MDLQDQLRRRSRRRRLTAARRYRSRLFWRTISRRRRLIGLILLAVLAALVGLVVYYTHPRRVERKAEEYLTRLTGRPVTIARARFSPFEGIRLQGLRIWPPGQTTGPRRDEDAEFKADEVLLKLEAGSLLTGRLNVEEIVAVRPQMKYARGSPTTQPAADRPQPPPPTMDIARMGLPKIDLREGRFLYTDRIAGKETVLYETAITAQLRPDPANPGGYRISGWAGRSQGELVPISGQVRLNPFSCQTNPLVVKSITQLPQEIERHLAEYRIDTTKVAIRAGYDARAGRLSVRFDCDGTRMTLPLGGLSWWAEGERAGQSPGHAAGPNQPAGRNGSIELTDVRGPIVVTVVNDPPEPAEPADPTGGPATRPDAARAVGRIAFGAADGDGNVTPLTGKLNGQPFSLQGAYDGFAADAPFGVRLVSERFELPQDPELIRQLPRPLRELWRYYRPRGTIRLALEIGRDKAGAEVSAKGVATCLAVSGVYMHYPYPADNVTGTIEFDSRQARLDLRGGRDPVAYSVTGTVGLAARGPVDIEVHARSIPVDEQAMTALAQSHADVVAVLRRLKVAGGRFDIKVTSRRPDRPGARTASQVTVWLHGVSLVLGEFPYPFCVLSGKLEVADDGIRLSGLEIVPLHLVRRTDPTAASPAGQMEYDTSARLLGDAFIGLTGHGDVGEVRLKLTSEVALPLDETLWRAFPPQVAEALARYHIDARAALFGTVHHKADGSLDYDFTVVLRDGYLKYDGFPYAMQSLTGQVNVNPKRILFTDVRGQHGVASFRLNGQVGLAGDQPTDLRIASDRVPLDDDLLTALPPNARAVWKQLAPKGDVAVDVSLKRNQSAESKPADSGDRQAGLSESGLDGLTPVITLTPLGAEVCHADFPYPLRGLTGQCVIWPDRVELVNLVSRDQERTVALSGTIWPGRDNMNLPPGQPPLPRFDVKVTASGLAFDERLRQALPGPILRRWNDVLPSGQFELALDRLRYTPLGTTGRWDLSGALDVRNGRAMLGVTLDRFDGQISGQWSLVTGQAAAFVGRIDLSGARVAGRTVKDVTGRLILDGRSGRLRLDDLAATLHGGQVSGFAQIGLEQADLPYAISLAGRDIDLNELINATRSPQEQWALSGKLEGRVAVEGRAGSASKRGRGEMVLTRAQICRVPALWPMFGPAQPAGANQSARIIFHLDNHRVTFEEAYIRDPALSLIGTGVHDLSTGQLDLTFVAGEPSAGSRGGSRVLEELFSGASAELIRYRITGSPSEPKTEPVTLHTLREAIDELAKARRRYQSSVKPAEGPPRLDTAPQPGIEPSAPKRAP